MAIPASSMHWADHIIHHIHDILYTGWQLDSANKQYYAYYNGYNPIQKHLFHSSLSSSQSIFLQCVQININCTAMYALE